MTTKQEILDALNVSLSYITTANGYTSDIGLVVRYMPATPFVNLPVDYIPTGGVQFEDTNEDYDYINGRLRSIMSVTIQAVKPALDNHGQIVNSLFKDLVKAAIINTRIDGVKIRITKSNVGIIDTEAKNTVAAILFIELDYFTDLLN